MAHVDAVGTHLACDLDLVVDHEGHACGMADGHELASERYDLIVRGVLLAQLDEGGAAGYSVGYELGQGVSVEPGPIGHGI